MGFQMQAIIFMGIQASGKTTFYKNNFMNTHLRISLDQLRTRNREKSILDCCIETKTLVVIDNTNPTRKDRERYIEELKKAGYQIIGYYFESTLRDALARNENRIGKAKIPAVGIMSTIKKFEVPSISEGFELIYKVVIADNEFQVTVFEERST